MTPRGSEPKLRARQPISEAPGGEAVWQQRRSSRRPVELDLSMGGERHFAGLVENVSAGGVFIATHLSRRVGDQVELTIHMPDGSSVRAFGEVRWVRPLSEVQNLPPGMGVRFTEIEQDGRDAIERFLSTEWRVDHDDEA